MEIQASRKTKENGFSLKRVKSFLSRFFEGFSLAFRCYSVGGFVVINLMVLQFFLLSGGHGLLSFLNCFEMIFLGFH